MWQGFQIVPDQASTIAQGVDYLYYFLTAIDLFFTAVIFLTIFYFALRYRRRSEHQQAEQIEGSLPLEIAWTLIPLGIYVLETHPESPPATALSSFGGRNGRIEA
jgi:cytochrome c oxidase subunit 2